MGGLPQIRGTFSSGPGALQTHEDAACRPLLPERQQIEPVGAQPLPIALPPGRQPEESLSRLEHLPGLLTQGNRLPERGQALGFRFNLQRQLIQQRLQRSTGPHPQGFGEAGIAVGQPQRPIEQCQRRGLRSRQGLESGGKQLGGPGDLDLLGHIGEGAHHAVIVAVLQHRGHLLQGSLLPVAPD